MAIVLPSTAAGWLRVSPEKEEGKTHCSAAPIPMALGALGASGPVPGNFMPPEELEMRWDRTGRTKPDATARPR